jgi:hypothetical protein
LLGAVDDEETVDVPALVSVVPSAEREGRGEEEDEEEEDEEEDEEEESASCKRSSKRD